MTPHVITLSGAIGIKAGLGREEIRIDLEELLPDDAITIALKGGNGAGKSTLLNLGMTPWLSPPITGNVYDHFGQTGTRELEWSHGGTRYRSVIQYRQSVKTKSTKAYLYRLTVGQWEPMRLPNELVSDGKTSTYEACLDHILGPQSLYYLSAFRAQNAPRLADYDDPKRLMRDLLRLDEIDTLSDSAKSVAADLKRRLVATRYEIHLLDSLRDQYDGISVEIVAEELASERIKKAKLEAQEREAFCKAELDSAIQREAVIERKIKLRSEIEKRFSERSSRRNDDIEQVEFDRRNIEWSRKKAEDEHDRGVMAIKRDIQAANSRADISRKTISRKDEIIQAVAMLADKTQVKRRIEEEISDLKDRAEEKQTASLKMTKLSGLIQQVIEEGKHLRSSVDDLSRRASYINRVPCHGYGEYAACEALQDAMDAANKIDATSKSRQAKLDEYHRLEAERSYAISSIASMGCPEKDLARKEQELREINIMIAELSKTAALENTLKSAGTQLDNEMELIKELHRRLEEKVAENENSSREYQQSMDRMSAKKSAINLAAEEDLRALRDELKQYLVGDDTSSVTRARQELKEASDLLARATMALDTNIATQAQRKAELAALRRAIESGAEIHETAKRIEDEIAHWTLLGVALKGVIDLSIEDAGPSIAAIANKLLVDAYGPRFTVRIVTQREQANGRLVECFDISVIDSESGIESSITKKSGGETVWLDKALTDAVGLYHQEASGVNYETLFADEAEDGLTEDMKLKFYRMDRAALEMGGYQRKFFVSHNQSAWNMADAVIDMNMLRSGND